MADGVDHIDIYADVGEEFNQVRERARAHAAEAGAAAAQTQALGPPRAASRRRCRPCAFAAAGRAPTPARRPPRPSFYGVVLRAADSATRRGTRSAAAGRKAAASGSSLAAASLPIVGGGRRALRVALGPAWGTACVCGGESGPPPRPLPCRGPRREPGEARAARRPLPGRAARAPISLFAPFCLLAAYGRLMEGRVHRPLYPARRASQALLAFAAGFGEALSSRSVAAASAWARLQQVL